MTFTAIDTKAFFSEELAAVTQQQGPVFDYVAGMLAARVTTTDSQVFSEEAISVMVSNLWGLERSAAPLLRAFDGRREGETRVRWVYEQFRGLGDELLFLCGLFPEAVDNAYKRRLVGLKFYMEQGPLCYDGAHNVLERHPWAGADDPGTLNQLAGQFPDWTESLFRLRERFKTLPEDARILQSIYEATRSPTARRLLQQERRLHLVN